MSDRHLVAVAGNPNAGKTTLFNALTGARAKVGNYPGITVERRVGNVRIDGVGTVEVVDIPGTYSLLARTEEEQIALEAMLGLGGNPRPDVVVMCVDATQVVRGLYVVLQALEMGLNVVIALTMVDEAKKAVVATLVREKPDRTRTDRVDRVLLNRFAGFAVFLPIMFIVFQSLFAWADPAITAIEDLFGWLGSQCEAVLPSGIVADFMVNGLVAGVGSVMVFLPQILLLFFFID